MNVILLGPPGCGKSTQAEILARRLGVPTIATGDLLSDAVQGDTQLGREAKRYMDRREMVPDEIILRLIKQQLASPKAAAGIVLDGFPRTNRQAQAVDRILAARGDRVNSVLLFDVPEEELIRRLLASASAEEGSYVTSDAIKHKVDAYRKSTGPLVVYYRELGVLSIVPGAGTVEEVAEEVKKAVGE